MKRLSCVFLTLAVSAYSTISFADLVSQVVARNIICGNQDVSFDLNLPQNVALVNSATAIKAKPACGADFRGAVGEIVPAACNDFVEEGITLVYSPIGDYEFGSDFDFAFVPGHSESNVTITESNTVGAFCGSRFGISPASYFLVATYAPTTPNHDNLTVYDQAPLAFGESHYLFTGDGAEAYADISFGDAIEVSTQVAPPVGSHWKLMLFANGSAAGFDGIDLSAYNTLSFDIRAENDVWVAAVFGSGDDTDVVPAGNYLVSNEYQTITIDIADADKSDINTFLWVYVHKDVNSTASWVNQTVSVDNIVLK